MKNKKMAVAGISLLGSIGVISTGFAGWIITAPAQRGSGTGAITADGTVETKGSLTLGTVTYDGGGNAGSIRFAANKESVTGGWLTSNDTAKAKLSTVITVPMTIGKDVKKINFTNVKLEATNNAANYKNLADLGIVGALPTLKTAAGDVNTTEGSIVISTVKPTAASIDANSFKAGSISTIEFATGFTEASFNFTVNFAWGTKFGGKNPMDHYNGESWSSTLEKDAAETIAKLNDLNGIGFELTFTVSADSGK